jgi:hypothetical protein
MALASITLIYPGKSEKGGYNVKNHCSEIAISLLTKADLHLRRNAKNLSRNLKISCTHKRVKKGA